LLTLHGQKVTIFVRSQAKELRFISNPAGATHSYFVNRQWSMALADATRPG
jgi:hypothetical protein